MLSSPFPSYNSNYNPFLNLMTRADHERGVGHSVNGVILVEGIVTIINSFIVFLSFRIPPILLLVAILHVVNMDEQCTTYLVLMHTLATRVG